MTNQSDNINELSVALIAAQALVQPAKKDSVNPHFKSGYASLQSVWDAARAVLAPHGLAISQGFIESNGEAVTVTTTLIHKSGQWLRSSLTMKPQRADPQGIGSAITYGRRYGLSAMLGIVADEDDDGNAASHPAQHQEPRKSQPIAHREPIGTQVQSLGKAIASVRDVFPESRLKEPVEQSSPQAGWRSFPCPKFIKKGEFPFLGDLKDNDIIWWANNYEPKPFKGQISQRDLDLKSALMEGATELAPAPTPRQRTEESAPSTEDVPF